ncbi:hypothetical protein [Tropicibacter sp. S64]|uniref:hypothetical protein n=1 Tax=Tropicibacter sp. S64 TaxID=3415122 RepID=UPI003C7B8A6F
MKHFVCAATALFLANPGFASQFGYECQVREISGGSYIPEVLFIGVDDQTKAVVVSDPVILYYNDRKPIAGRIKTDNAKRTTFAWDIRIKNDFNQIATIQYRATYMKANGELNLSALPVGYADTFRGKGKCEKKPIR